ncbi:leucyl aminopeptidase [Candidatus Woesearchaeota archaeon]|nr:MAG: leucyl aminopeptidase [Candidatus Woesearchaeota archaeon]
MLNVRAKYEDVLRVEGPLVLFTFEDDASREWAVVDKALRGFLAGAKRSGEFSGKKEEVLLLHRPGVKASHLLVAGLGKKKECSLEVVRRACATAVKRLSAAHLERASIAPPEVENVNEEEVVFAVAEAASLALYRFEKYKTEKKKEKRLTSLTVLSKEAGAVKRARIVAEAVYLMRDLQNTPGADMGPAELARVAKRVAKTCGFSCTVWGKREIEKKKMGGLLAVNKGSSREPRFVVMKYVPKGAKRTLCLVGKGVTFDTGGVQVKPGDYMNDMQMDMSGAALVIAALQAVAKLRLNVAVIGVMGLTDNLMGNTPYLPGDVVKTMSGKTIEIGHTDAEGRVTLADSLYYASTLKPDLIVDFATLTGACMVALGMHASGVFGTDQQAVEALLRAGERTHDLLWQLPLFDEYSEDVKGVVGDVSNIGSADRYGGACTAAAFLKEFVGGSPWVHVDMSSAILKKEKHYKPKGGSGEPLRAVLSFLQERVTF